MQFVFNPALRIGGDIFGNPVVIGFITDYVFIIVALPDRYAGSITQFVNSFGNRRFETRHHRPK